MVSRPLVFIVLLSSVWLQADALLVRKLVRAKSSDTVDAASMNPNMPNLDPDKLELFGKVANAAYLGQPEIIESIFSSQRDDVSKELLMAKTSVGVYALPNGESYVASNVTLLGVTMARLADQEYDEFVLAGAKQALLVLAKLHLKYDVPLDAEFNGFYQIDKFKNTDMKLYLQEDKIEFKANSFEQFLERFSEEKRKLELEGFLAEPDVWTWKVTDANGKRDTWKLEFLNDLAFPVEVELVVRNSAR